jgi:hypothetical protein
VGIHYSIYVYPLSHNDFGRTIEDGGRLKINILDLEGDVFQGTDYPATAA